MKKFKCTVTRTDEYEIEIDENIINEEWMEHFRSYMYGFDELSEHAEHLAQFQAGQVVNKTSLKDMAMSHEMGSYHIAMKILTKMVIGCPKQNVDNLLQV